MITELEKERNDVCDYIHKTPPYVYIKMLNIVIDVLMNYWNMDLET